MFSTEMKITSNFQVCNSQNLRNIFLPILFQSQNNNNNNNKQIKQKINTKKRLLNLEQLINKPT